MRKLIILRQLALLSALLALVACAGPGPAPSQAAQAYSRAALLDGSVLGLPPELKPPAPQLLAVNDDMRAFLAEHTPRKANKKQKVEQILRAILDDGLRLDYNLFHTLTAEEAFYTREGNCMSFTNLFVALAREAGIPARFQEVEVPPTWEARNETWLYNKHLNAVVDLPGGSMMVDFAMESFDTEYKRHLLDDEEVQARYHNNMGVHLMMDHEFTSAYLHFSRAVSLAPDTGYFWTNLGSLYRRAGEEAAAEAAYLRAIDVSREPAAMSNLARLYRQQDKENLAVWYEGKVELFRLHNPYYLHELALQAFEAGDYPLAVSRSRSALRLDKAQHEIYRLLGLSYVALGQLDDAGEAFTAAARLAESDEQKAGYSKKIRLLAGH